MPRTVFFVLCIIFSGCCISCGNNKTETRVSKKTRDTGKELFRLASPTNGETFKSKDTLTLDLKSISDTVKFDSCILNIDGKHYASVHSLPQKIAVAGVKMGVRRLSLSIFFNSKIIDNLQFALKIIPTSEPEQYKYRVVKEYPHDESAYTQGLFFSKGFLYEGTGLLGKSLLRKVEIETGKVLQVHNLDKQYFGEGICLHKGKIYQLTWKNHEGFIYDYETFNLTGKFNYNSEGWGITSDGDYLLMSDGTSYLYKFNDNMNIVEQIEVYTNKGPVHYLNELEYIDGQIWANVYDSDNIVIINPKTGEVTGMLNLANILKKEYRKPSVTDVLNGIAYDHEKKKLIVTGKNWSRLFEIAIYR
ncbi:MAG: glutaminyl-peptide cyclotransferase [Prevotellaceae bacterium]|jgi:glutamine cyclotransferase|nr:glutaminyl-peptide cyclotransferase [Prevotellaceae bacterium]